MLARAGGIYLISCVVWTLRDMQGLHHTRNGLRENARRAGSTPHKKCLVANARRAFATKHNKFFARRSRASTHRERANHSSDTPCVAREPGGSQPCPTLSIKHALKSIHYLEWRYVIRQG